MSKIGKMPIVIPSGVTVTISDNVVEVKGPKGTLNFNTQKGVDLKLEDGNLLVSVSDKMVNAKSMHGTVRSILSNMVLGVTEGWKKDLELVGTGYRAEVRGDTLVLTVGFSHPVNYKAFDGIKFEVVKNTITVSGADKEKVGEAAANIRAVRPPEPYKGKGIKYVDEVIRRKAGKAAKTGASA